MSVFQTPLPPDSSSAAKVAESFSVVDRPGMARWMTGLGLLALNWGLILGDLLQGHGTLLRFLALKVWPGAAKPPLWIDGLLSVILLAAGLWLILGARGVWFRLGSKLVTVWYGLGIPMVWRSYAVGSFKSVRARTDKRTYTTLRDINEKTQCSYQIWRVTLEGERSLRLVTTTDADRARSIAKETARRLGIGCEIQQWG
jgi:hypothetical protein